MSMDTELIGKTLDTVNSTSKLLTNVTQKFMTPKTEEKKEEHMNQPHSQTVEVKVGNPDEVRKPMILKEKSETHIHKVFPDNRELSVNECEMRKLELQLQHEREMRKLEFEIECDRNDREERREHEEYARRERDRRREADRRFTRRVAIGAGIVAAGFLGYTAYTLYTDSRRAHNNRISVGEPSAVQLTADEGSVQ